MSLYTKNGKPLQVSGNSVYTRSGTYVGQISGNKVFGTNGRYVGTIDGDRLVHRSVDSAYMGSPSISANQAGSGAAATAGSAIWGDEPKLLD